MNCRRCGAEMVAGIATGQTVVAHDDFGGDAGQDGTTVTSGGPGKLIECLKCPACGHSVAPGRLDEIRERLATPNSNALADNAPADLAWACGEIERLKVDKSRLVALLSRARPNVLEEGGVEDVLDCAIVEEIDLARKEPA